MGGLPRRATFFRQLQDEGELVYFDLGNNFPKPSEQGNLKVSLIHQSLKEMNPSVILLGPNEWSYGKEFIDPGMPYLLSNGSGKLPYFDNFQTKIGNRTVQVLGYLSPSLVYQNPNDPPSVFPVDQELLEQWKGATDEEAWKLLLFRGSQEELELFQRSEWFDLIVAGSNNDDELEQQMAVQTSLGEVPMIPTKGQGIVAGSFNSGKLEARGELEIPENLGVTWLRSDFDDVLDTRFMFC